MGSVDQALASQLRNLQDRSGRSLDELYGMLRSSGLSKHGELRDLLKTKLGMGHGDANTLVHTYLQGRVERCDAGRDRSRRRDLRGPEGGPAPDPRSLHGRHRRASAPYEVAPKKGYVSLRRKKQFAMIGPGTKPRRHRPEPQGRRRERAPAHDAARRHVPVQGRGDRRERRRRRAHVVGAQGVRRGGMIARGGGMKRLQRWFVVGVASLARPRRSRNPFRRVRSR